MIRNSIPRAGAGGSPVGGGSGENPDAVAGPDLLSTCARRSGPGACCRRQQGHPAADQGQPRTGRARGRDRGRWCRVSGRGPRGAARRCDARCRHASAGRAPHRRPAPGRPPYAPPALAIISACTQYEVETGLDVGVDAFLAKPFEPAELVRLVKSLIAGAGRTAGGRTGGAWGAVLGGDGGGSRGDEDQAGVVTGGSKVTTHPPPTEPPRARIPTDGGSSANASSAHGIPSTHGCPAHGASSAHGTPTHATPTHGTPPTQGVPPDTPRRPRDGGVSDGVPGGMPFGG